MKNLYKTKQKASIVDFLKTHSSGHITAAGIVAALKNSGEKISTATVYRHLNALVAAGEVRKYITGNGACYQYSGGDSDGHFHLKCTQCGTLMHIDCDLLSSLAPHIMKHHKFKVDSLRTVMYGVCEKCIG